MNNLNPLDYIINPKEIDNIQFLLLNYIQSHSLKKDSLILNSLQYTKHICQNPECKNITDEDIRKELILSHALSSNWVFRPNNEYDKLYTLYINYKKFPNIDFEKSECLQLFYKNSNIKTRKEKRFSEYNKEFYDNYYNYIPAGFYNNLFQNIYEQTKSCFNFYIFSNFKKYCSTCDEKLFKPIDGEEEKINILFFEKKINTPTDRYLILKRFQDYFNYRIDNKKYILQKNIKELIDEGEKLSKISHFDLFNQQIAKLIDLRNTLQNNIEQNQPKINSCFHIIFNPKYKKTFYDSDLGINKCCCFLIEQINDLIDTKTELILNSYDNSIQVTNNRINNEKKAYKEILENHISNDYSFLQKDLSQMDVIYCDKEKTANFFGFSYFTLSNIVQFINENIPENHKIVIDINKDDGGYCFLTPMKDEERNSFYVFSDNNVKEKIDSLIESIYSLLKNKYKKEELLSVFYYSAFLWESENLCIYSKEKECLKQIKEFLKIIKSQDENKIENLIKFFRETSINK